MRRSPVAFNLAKYLRPESNWDLLFRRESFYPLNYKGAFETIDGPDGKPFCINMQDECHFRLQR